MLCSLSHFCFSTAALTDYKSIASELLPALRNRCHLHHLTFSKSNTTAVLSRVNSKTGEEQVSIPAIPAKKEGMPCDMAQLDHMSFAN
eukprot:SAG11_NODE_15208_length_585_cov_1.395062_1_plen_87_part_10